MSYPNLQEGQGDAPPAYNPTAPTMPMQQVVYQQPPTGGQQQYGQPQYGQPQQQVVYAQQPPTQYGQPQQVVYQQPPTQGQYGGQPQVVYVQQQPQTQQPIIINNNTNQNNQQTVQQQQVVSTMVVQRQPVDDPSCLYVLAFFGLIIPLVGFIGMCAYNCGSGLPPRQAQAFRVMVILTIVGCIWLVAVNAASGA